MKRSSAIALVIALVVTNGFWIYRTFDNGVTLTYAQADIESGQKLYGEAVALANLNLIGRSIDEARKLIGMDVYGLEPFEKEGCLYAGGICVRFDADRTVVAIELH